MFFNLAPTLPLPLSATSPSGSGCFDTDCARGTSALLGLEPQCPSPLVGQGRGPRCSLLSRASCGFKTDRSPHALAR